jgi:amino acid transporter
MADDSNGEKMGFSATWAMAVGGMVGGGIFSVLGVVIEMAGRWAWLSFVLAGIIALTTGHSYVALASKFEEGGGAFTYLREIDHEGMAGSLSWVLIIGYVLTISVYAFTFGHYLAAVMGSAEWISHVAAVTIVVVLIGVNLLGVGEASWLEIITVWGKLIVLVGLAVIGLWHFRPEAIEYANADPGGLGGALLGAASIFMAYEGFQLLSYDYEDIRSPDKTLRRATMWAIMAVIAVYVVVSLGAVSLVGASKMLEHKETALASAGQQALGMTGKVLVSIAAAFSTASAINATLFSTARLTAKVADDGELPKWFQVRNRHHIPARAVVSIGVVGATLAVIGGLGQLVEAASLAFLFAFASVNVVAARQTNDWRWLGWAGAVLAIVAAVALIVRLALNEPISLALLAALVLFATVGRALILRMLRTKQ